jgi:4-diphosphocytidyl-2-C-methyl-D-erythritol kinase
VSKRPDGYHDLETCFYSVPWRDVLEILPAAKITFTSSGTPIPGSQDDNLCLKAYHLLAADYKIPPVSIHLHKVIPTGAGLGGGSSDGAHTLRLLNTIFELNISQQALMRVAAKLGSDCAFFIQDEPMIGRGRGEELSPVTIGLKGKFLMLVKPDIHVSTASAYAHVVPTKPKNPLADILRRPASHWKDLLINDFESSVFHRHPGIESIKQELYTMGATYASMSGSGASVFGIFEKPVATSTFEKHTVWWGRL